MLPREWTQASAHGWRGVIAIDLLPVVGSLSPKNYFGHYTLGGLFSAWSFSAVGLGRADQNERRTSMLGTPDAWAEAVSALQLHVEAFKHRIQTRASTATYGSYTSESDLAAHSRER